eukprot:5410917-Ditylum_brightwellii.AAC.1
MVQRSKDSCCTKALESIDGVRAYLLMVDHYSDKLWGVCADSKVPPIKKRFKNFLAQHSPSVQGKYAYMDLGDELGRNNEIITLLEKYDYIISSTASDSSHHDTR